MKDRSVLYFLDAYDDDNLSDGAWWSRLEEGVTAWNELNNDNLDPHEIVSEYVAIQSEKTPTLYGFECPKCFIRSGMASCDSGKAPTCCGGVAMAAYEIKDLHAWTAASLLSKNVEDVTPEERRMAKVKNFASLFGSAVKVTLDDRSTIPDSDYKHLVKGVWTVSAEDEEVDNDDV